MRMSALKALVLSLVSAAGLLFMLQINYMQRSSVVREPDSKDNRTAWNYSTSMIIDDDLAYVEDMSGTASSDEAQPLDAKYPNQTLKILVLAYQRTGSTFFADFFNAKPDVFYLFEPIDAVYSHLYGTQPGWAVPSELHYYPNGTYRKFPSFEQAEIEGFLRRVFSCDFHNTPNEFLSHKFWEAFKQSDTYEKCLKKERISDSRCAQMLRRVCPERVGYNTTQEVFCAYHLNDSRPEGLFKTYKSCSGRQRHTLESKCVHHLVNECKSRRLFLIKTVRLEMKNLVNLFKWDPHFHVIHLFRDPRSVILSRLKTDWATQASTPNIASKVKSNKSPEKLPRLAESVVGLTQPRTSNTKLKKDNGNYRNEELLPAISKEAFLYCDLLSRSFKAIQDLPEVFQNRVHQVVYEDLINEPFMTMRQVHKFLGEAFGQSESDKDWVAKVTAKSGKSHSKDVKWMTELPVDMLVLINKQCSHVYQLIGDRWPLVNTP